MDRDERLAAAKRRAHEFLAQCDVRNAICSMMSDVKADPEIGLNDAIAAMGLMIAMNEDELEARRWIDGFR
jgi:hypothetical protein